MFMHDPYGPSREYHSLRGVLTVTVLESSANFNLA